MGDEADTPRYIETLPRKGYRFIGTLTPPTAERAKDRRLRGHRWVAIAVAVMCVALAVAVLLS